MRYWRGWEKTWWYRRKGKKISFWFMYCWPRHHYGILQINSIELWRLSPKKGILSYIRFTHLEDTSLQWCCSLNIYKTSLSSMIATLLVIYSHGSNAAIRIFHLLWWEYSYLAQSFMAEFSYLTLVSVSPLKPLLGAMYWNPEYLLYFLLIYKTSSYTVIC